MLVIVTLYVLIGLALRRSSSISNTNSSASHYHSPHHLCNQTNLNTKTNSMQRNNNSIVVDNNSSPTTLIYNDKSVTFYTGLDKQRKNSILNSNEQLDKSVQFKKDKDPNNRLSSPTKTAKQTRPSFDEQDELIELNNNNQNFNKSSLFLNINNGASLTAHHRPSDIITTPNNLNSPFNSSNSNNLNANNLNSASILTTPTTQAVTVSSAAAGNSSSLHHRHHQTSTTTSRRSVIKMLGEFLDYFFFLLFYAFFLILYYALCNAHYLWGRKGK